MSQKLPADPRARLRLRWIQHYEQVTKKAALTCRYFGISRGTFYLWYHQYLSLGADGLLNKSCRPHRIHHWIPADVRNTIIQLRLQKRYGPQRMSWHLKRKYNWYVFHHSVWRLYKTHGLNRLGYKRKWERYPQRYSKPIPGDRVQLDMKFLKDLGLGGGQYYQFTAIDDCTRYRVLRIYDHNTVKNATDFINQVKEVMPFTIRQVQTDNGSEFSHQFSWHLEDLGIDHRKTRIRSPEENGQVERSHRTDDEEFYRINQFVSISHCIQLLRQWEKDYNEDRPHTSLGGKTPAEFLQEKLKNHISKSVQVVP